MLEVFIPGKASNWYEIPINEKDLWKFKHPCYYCGCTLKSTGACLQRQAYCKDCWYFNMKKEW